MTEQERAALIQQYQELSQMKSSLEKAPEKAHNREELIKEYQQLAAQKKRMEANFGERGPQDYGSRLKRNAGLAGRVLAGLPGDVADIGLLPYNITQAVQGKSGVSVGNAIRKNIYDPLTEGKFVPESKGEKILSEIGSAIIPMGPLSLAGKIATKSLPRAGKFFHQAFKPTLPNVTGVASGTAAAHKVAEDNPESTLAPFAAAILAGGAGSAAASALKGIGGAGIAGVKNLGEGIRNARTNAAIRHPSLGKKIEDVLPHHFGLTDEPHIPLRNIGEKQAAAASARKEAQKQYFKKEYGDIEKIFNQIASPDQRILTVQEPVNWILGKLKQSGKSKDVTTTNQFMEEEYGKILADLLGVEKKGGGSGSLTQKQLYKIMKNEPERLARPVDIDTIVNWRKRLDKIIKQPEWNHVGADKKGLTAFRRVLEDMREKTYKDISPELYGKLKHTNKEFKHYMDKEAPSINRIKDVEDHAGKSYKASLADISDTGEDIQRSFDRLPKDQQKEFAQRIIEDLSITSKGRSSKKFNEKMSQPNMEPEVAEMIYSHLDPDQTMRLKKMQATQKGLEHIQAHSSDDFWKNLHIPGATLLPKLGRGLATIGMDSEKGIENAIRRAHRVGEKPTVNWKKRTNPSDEKKPSISRRLLEHAVRTGLPNI